MMYEPRMDLLSLRQGDVLKGVYIPRYSIKGARVLATIQADHQLSFDKQLVLTADVQHAVVISQCCEFQPNKRKDFVVSPLLRLSDLSSQVELSMNAWGISLAMLLPTSKSFASRLSLDLLRRSNDVESYEAGQAHAVNAFLYEPDGGELAEPHVVDFSRIVSIGMDAAQQLVQQKILELTDTSRTQLQAKLAYYFSRPADP